MLTSKLHS